MGAFNLIGSKLSPTARPRVLQSSGGAPPQVCPILGDHSDVQGDLIAALPCSPRLMEGSATAGGSRGNEKVDPSQLLERLHLEDDELDNIVCEEEVDGSEEKPKWLALAQVLTEKNFS